MADRITRETIEYAAILAKLELSEEEKEQAGSDMERMLDYIDKLNELVTEGVDPMSHVLAAVNVFREDEAEDGGGREQTLANAPQVKDGMFRVPRTVE